MHTRLVLLVTLGVALGGCSETGPSPVVRTLTGDYGLLVSAAPSCIPTLPSGYGVAPRGGGRATLTQSGGSLSGVLYIGDTPSGSISGTIDGGVVAFTFSLDGRNVGVLTPADEPCRVVGLATGSTDGNCFVSARIAGDFACPYSCTASDHIVNFTRGRDCR